MAKCFFSVMQERLAQQQKIMAEEKAYLKEIISRMDTQLNEQQRQIEKVNDNLWAFFFFSLLLSVVGQN